MQKSSLMNISKIFPVERINKNLSYVESFCFWGFSKWRVNLGFKLFNFKDKVNEFDQR